MNDQPSIEAFAEAVAAGSPAPGGGAVAAVVAALAAALAGMLARLGSARADQAGQLELGQLAERADALRGRLLALSERDEAAYRAVVKARRAGGAELAQAWQEAVRVPAAVVSGCRDATLLVRRAVDLAPPAAVGDAVMAALLAAAAAAGSAVNVRANAEAAGRPESLRPLWDQAERELREIQPLVTEIREKGDGGRER
ncbi:MAG TPA: cyclodeaminase/cyclohydrolase family protein [Gemmatimonadales bacterium]|nr:cyclodeaminase/cyclohydrolase family protein [Gemmatimonadales bacterium]